MGVVCNGFGGEYVKHRRKVDRQMSIYSDVEPKNVVDARGRLEQYWKGYWSLKNSDDRKLYLMDCLPKKMANRNDRPLFDV